MRIEDTTILITDDSILAKEYGLHQRPYNRRKLGHENVQPGIELLTQILGKQQYRLNRQQ